MHMCSDAKLPNEIIQPMNEEATPFHLINIEAIGKKDGGNQCPQVDRIAHPSADDLHPASPVCSAHGREVLCGLRIQTLGQ